MITHGMNEWEHFLNERLEWMINKKEEWGYRMIENYRHDEELMIEIRIYDYTMNL